MDPVSESGACLLTFRHICKHARIVLIEGAKVYRFGICTRLTHLQHAWRDSNPQPSVPKTDALSVELHAQGEEPSVYPDACPLYHAHL